MKNTVVIIFVLCICNTDTYITKYVLKRLECESDGTYMIDPVCRLKGLKRDLQYTTVAVSAVKPISNMWIRMSQHKKTNTNHFMPGLFDITMNYCEMANQTNAAAAFSLNTVKTLFPPLYQQFQKNVKYCPFLGYCVLFNKTEKRVIETQFVIPPGEYKTEFRAYDAKNRTLLHVKLFQLYLDKNRQS